MPDVAGIAVFNQRVKHGTADLHPNVVYGFEDPDAVPYFIACGWAAESTDEPQVVISLGEIDVDPCTIWAGGENKHKFVMPERAAEARGITVEEAQAFVWAGEDLRNG